MAYFMVELCRTAHGHVEIVVEAEDEDLATDAAREYGGSVEFSEHTSEYTAEVMKEIPPSKVEDYGGVDTKAPNPAFVDVAIDSEDPSEVKLLSIPWQAWQDFLKHEDSDDGTYFTFGWDQHPSRDNATLEEWKQARRRISLCQTA